MGNGASLTVGYDYLGFSGTGSFTQTGGAVYLPPEVVVAPVLVLGDGPGSTGIYNLSAGSFTSWFTMVGGSGTGIFTQTGGVSSDSLSLGENPGSDGTYNLIAGSNQTLDIFVGLGGTGSFIQTGGTNTLNSGGTGGTLYLGEDAGGMGTYLLSGGLLNTYKIIGGSGTGIFDFNGGTLQAGAADSAFMAGLTTANVQAGGAVIDTNQYDITISQPLLHDSVPAIDGGLTKIGAGTLTLSGSNGYTGVTSVDAGTLEFAQELSLYGDNAAQWTAANIKVSPGAILALRVGGAGDFTSSDLTGLLALGSATGGFENGSYAGIDTNDGNFTYSAPISNPNGGANALGIVKTGSNALTLAGVETYTGNTTVTSGTLAITGTLNTPNSALIVDGTAASYVLATAGSVAFATLSGSGSISTSYIYVGRSGTGTFVQTSGSNTVGSGLVIGASQAGNGACQISGGTLKVTGSAIVGGSGAGILAQTGGAVTIGDLKLGDAPGASGTYQLSAGSLQSQVIEAGANPGGVGAFIEAGGTVTNTTDVAIGEYGANGSYSLNGGTLITPGIVGGTGAGIFNFDGGALEAGGTSSAFVSGLTTAYVRAGGAIINTNGYAVTIPQPLLHDPHDTAPGTQAADGGLTKNGLGTLTLSSSNNYAGPTTVNAGTLDLSGSTNDTQSGWVAFGAALEVDGLLNHSSTTTVDGTLRGNGSLGAVSVAGGGTLAPGYDSASGSAGMLTANGNVSLTDSTSIFSIRLGVATPTDHDELTIDSGNVTLNDATLRLTLGSNFALQSQGFIYVLINGQPADSTFTGEFAEGNSITVDGDLFDIVYGENATDTGSGHDVLLVSMAAVPEPGAGPIIAAAMAAMAAMRSRRRK